MEIKSLRAVSFRNIERETVHFSPGVNLLYGDNAEGKTNLLEAVYYFARGKSFRGATDRELCRFGDAGFEIEASFLGGGREQTLLYRSFGKDKVRKRNGAPVDTAGEMIGHLRAVLFHPEHLLLVKGSPEKRREFLNIAIAQNDPSYIPLYATYQKILENRNSLLKTAQKGGPLYEDELDIWSQKLAEAAALLAVKRYEYVRELAPAAADLLSEFSEGRERLSLSYLSEIPEESVPILSERYVTLLRKDVRREVAAGFTVHGPHHDDLDIRIGDKTAREYASQGQQRSITLSLKLAEGEVSYRRFSEYPLFLFDDVLSELDPGRRRFLLSSLSSRQILITACDDRDFENSAARRIKTVGGSYEIVAE